MALRGSCQYRKTGDDRKEQGRVKAKRTAHDWSLSSFDEGQFLETIMG